MENNPSIVGLAEHISADQNRLVLAGLEASTTAIIITDLEGHIIFANPAFEKITGYPVADIMGLKPSFLKSGMQPKSFYKNLWETVLAGEIWNGIFVNRRKDGRLYNEQCSISPIRDPNGNITHFVASKEDITEKLKADMTLRSAKVKAENLTRSMQVSIGQARAQAKRAEAAMRTKQEFLAMVSHELRTPLNAILGFTDLLKEDPLTDSQKESVQTIRESGEVLLTLIDEMLQYSQLDIDSKQTQLEEFLPSDAIQQVRRMLSSKATEKGLEMHVAMGPEFQQQIVMADRMALMQILINLVHNAIKFTDSGLIEIEANIVEHLNAHALQISVADSGPGIHHTVLDKIFEPFEQGDSGNQRTREGLGLGLSICRELVDRAGGNIACESELKHGSTFSFIYPCELINNED